MLGDMIVPTSGSAGLVSNTVGADFGQPVNYQTTVPQPERVYHYATGDFDQQVIADSTGRIVAGDYGQITVSQWLSANPKALVTGTTGDPRLSIIGNYPPNYAAYAALAVVAFLALRGLR
jgi:hypothetical protein